MKCKHATNEVTNAVIKHKKQSHYHRNTEKKNSHKEHENTMASKNIEQALKSDNIKKRNG